MYFAIIHSAPPSTTVTTLIPESNVWSMHMHWIWMVNKCTCIWQVFGLLTSLADSLELGMMSQYSPLLFGEYCTVVAMPRSFYWAIFDLNFNGFTLVDMSCFIYLDIYSGIIIQYLFGLPLVGFFAQGHVEILHNFKVKMSLRLIYVTCTCRCDIITYWCRDKMAGILQTASLEFRLQFDGSFFSCA